MDFNVDDVSPERFIVVLENSDGSETEDEEGAQIPQFNPNIVHPIQPSTSTAIIDLASVIEKDTNVEQNESDSNKRKWLDECTQCSICYDQWGREGLHRVACLPCGHMFGWSCIDKWRRRQSVKRRDSATCPKCQYAVVMSYLHHPNHHPFKMTHVRPLFPEVVIAVDRERLDKQMETIEEQRKRIDLLERQLTREKLASNIAKAQERRSIEQYHLLQEEYRKYQLLANTLDKDTRYDTAHTDDNNNENRYNNFEDKQEKLNNEIVTPLMQPLGTFSIDTAEYGLCDGSFRVMGFDRCQDVLYTSFSGRSHPQAYVLKTSLIDTSITEQILVHSKPIKAITPSPYHDHQLITASVDNWGALIDTKANVVAAKFALDAQGFSCTYHNTNPHLLIYGLHTNAIILFDIRRPDQVFEQLYDASVMGSMNGRAIHSIAHLSNTLLTSSLFCGSLWTPLDYLNDTSHININRSNDTCVNRTINSVTSSHCKRTMSMPSPSLNQQYQPQHITNTSTDTIISPSNTQPTIHNSISSNHQSKCVTAYDVSSTSMRCTGMDGRDHVFVAQLRNGSNVCEYIFGELQSHVAITNDSDSLNHMSSTATTINTLRRIKGTHSSTLMSRFAVWRNQFDPGKHYFAVSDEITKQIEIYDLASQSVRPVQCIDTFADTPLIDVKKSHDTLNSTSILAGLTEKGQLYLYSNSGRD